MQCRGLQGRLSRTGLCRLTGPAAGASDGGCLLLVMCGFRTVLVHVHVHAFMPDLHPSHTHSHAQLLYLVCTSSSSTHLSCSAAAAASTQGSMAPRFRAAPPCVRCCTLHHRIAQARPPRLSGLSPVCLCPGCSVPVIASLLLSCLRCVCLTPGCTLKRGRVQLWPVDCLRGGVVESWWACTVVVRAVVWLWVAAARLQLRAHQVCLCAIYVPVCI